MNDASSALQVAIASLLEASASIPFYDGAPEDRPFPSITLGPSDYVPDDEECIDAVLETVQLDIWTREGGVLIDCKRLLGELYALLHEADLVLADPYAAGSCRVALARAFLDRDGVTAHGVLQVSVEIETVA